MHYSWATVWLVEQHETWGSKLTANKMQLYEAYQGSWELLLLCHHWPDIIRMASLSLVRLSMSWSASCSLSYMARAIPSASPKGILSEDLPCQILGLQPVVHLPVQGRSLYDYQIWRVLWRKNWYLLFKKSLEPKSCSQKVWLTADIFALTHIIITN